MGVTYESYLNGATIWGVDMEHADAFKLIPGSLDLHIDFETDTPQAYMILVMGEYPKTLHFDQNRKLTAGPPPFR